MCLHEKNSYLYKYSIVKAMALPFSGLRQVAMSMQVKVVLPTGEVGETSGPKCRACPAKCWIGIG